MYFSTLSASERRTLPPAIAVSTVAFALAPPAGALIGTGTAHGASVRDAAAHSTDVYGADGSETTTVWLPLVRRTRAPFEGYWALPGGPTEWDETLTDTAQRTIHAAAQRIPSSLEQLYSFGAVERSAEAQRLVTIAYWAQFGERDLEAPPSIPPARASESAGSHSTESAGPDRRPRRWDDVPAPSLPAAREMRQAAHARSAEPDPNVAWFSVDRLPDLAFDHDEIVRVALDRLRTKTAYAAVAHRFLGPEFTLAQLRGVHEAILGHAVDPANFRRQVLASGSLAETGDLQTGAAHRPAKLYRFTESPDRELENARATTRSRQ